ncbi:hypothetical protein JHK85_009527 [Glycine max]|nr:hypothetical protein JHK85_009527 [Glycine max]
MSVSTACDGNRPGKFPPGNLFVAVIEGLWDNGAACGRRYRIRCVSGNNRPCKGGSIDVKALIQMEEMEEVEEKGNGEDPSPNWRTKRNESITNLKLAFFHIEPASGAKMEKWEVSLHYDAKGDKLIKNA